MRSAKDALGQESGAAAREALRLFTEIGQRCPCSESVACLQMEALMKARPGQGAAQVVAESARWLRKSSDNPDLLCVRGKGLYGTGQLDQALKHFAEALRLDPDHAGSKAMRARLKELDRVKKAGNDAFSSGRYDEAIERYSECIALDPDNHDLNLTLYTNRATAKFKKSDYSAAMEDCNTALGIQPRHLKALLRRAACKLELEDYKGAISDYEEAHEIDPNEQSIKQSIRHAKIELKKSQRKDLYKVLGVTKHATDHEIKKAYKKMALQCHPDRMTNASDEEKAVAEKRFKEVGEAFEVLSDTQKKQKWDAGESLDEINGNGGGGGGRQGGIDPADIFRMYGGMGGGGFRSGGGFGF
uniref:J domain-containing protein n=1 Tax=Haptolina brevifila TaxID=156173 RepID=A0A7S2G167_9EUKA